MQIIPKVIKFAFTAVGCVVVARAIPPLARALLKDDRITGYEDEERVREFIELAWATEDNEDEDDVDDDTFCPSPEVEAKVPGHNGRVVRRHRRLRFARKMAWWLRAEFPDAWRTRTEADDAVMRIAVTKHMRDPALNVRNADVALLLPQIMALVYLPTRQDIMYAKNMATRAADDAYGAHKGWAPGKSLLQKLGLVSRQPGFKLSVK